MDATWTRRGQEHANGFVRRLREAQGRARLAVLHKLSKLAECLDTDAAAPLFQTGDVLLVRRQIRQPHLSEKLLPRYCGTFQIKKKQELGAVTYRLEELSVHCRRKA